MRLRSSHLKAGESGDWLGLGFVYTVDSRGTRSLLQTRTQTGELIARTDRQDFYAAVGIVADPAGNFQDMRLAFDEPAETDALHASADQKAPSLDRTLLGR